MAHAPSHISRRRGSGVFMYRRRVPDDVRGGEFFGGRQHYQVSLGTSDLHEAKTKALPIGLRFDVEVANLRAGSVKAKRLIPGEQSVLTEDALEAIQGKWFTDGVKRDREKRKMADEDPEGDWAHHLEGQDDWLHMQIALLNDPTVGRQKLRELKADLKSEWSDSIAVVARRWHAAPNTDDYRRIEAAILDAQVEVLRASHMGWGGHQQETSSQAVRRGLARSLKPESSWTITQLAKHMLEVDPKGASWEHKMLEQVLPLFVSHLGAPRPIAEIASSDIRTFIERLRQCPTNAAQRFPNRSLAEAIQLNRARAKPYPTLKPNTIRDTHYAVLRSLFAYALTQEWLVVSPANGVKVPGAVKRGGRRPSFKVEELAQLFQQPVFTGCKSQQHFCVPGSIKLDDHRYWTPLLMLFSGARPSELGQLAVSDVKLDARTPYISILTEFDPDDPDDKPFYITCKTENARREVPIHPMLLELGFGGYVKRMQHGGHARLFPEWKLSSDARKLYSGASWVRRFNEDIIPTCTERHPRPTFYSLRHTFKVAMAAHGIYPAIQNQMLGHANVGMDAHYFDAIPLEELHRQIGQVSYKHLDLSHLVGSKRSISS